MLKEYLDSQTAHDQTVTLPRESFGEEKMQYNAERSRIYQAHRNWLEHTYKTENFSVNKRNALFDAAERKGEFGGFFATEEGYKWVIELTKMVKTK